MKLRQLSTLGLLALASSASFADTFSGPIDLGTGNAFFGRSTAVGSFVDTWTFTLASSSWFATSSVTSSTSGTQSIAFSSIVLENAANAVVATFAGNLGTATNAFYALSPTLLSAGTYEVVVTGVNSPSQASYSGNIGVTAVPEPATSALLFAGLGVIGLVSSRRKKV